jgi:YggT family protein
MVIAISFIITIIFQLYLLAVFLRLLLQLVKADFYNPICQFLMKVTNPFLIPLRKIIPGFYGIDCAALVLLYIVQFIEISIIFGLQTGGFTPWIFLGSIFALLSLLVNIYFYLIILRAIGSWFQPSYKQPLYNLILVLTEPILRPLRKVIPVTGMIDWSSLVALIILIALRVFFSSFVV